MGRGRVPALTPPPCPDYWGRPNGEVTEYRPGGQTASSSDDLCAPGRLPHLRVPRSPPVANGTNEGVHLLPVLCGLKKAACAPSLSPDHLLRTAGTSTCIALTCAGDTEAQTA